MGMVPATHYLALGAVLFVIGVAGFIVRRNVITMFMSVELMLNAVNLTFLAYARTWNQVDAHIFVFFVMTVAAAEAAVGLALILGLDRHSQTLDVDSVNQLRG